MRKQLLISIIILIFLGLGTLVVIMYGKGYQLNFNAGRPEFLGTGLLVATSVPDGAQVFINDHLSTATNNTINLAPGTYNVRIFKEGYFPWQKQIRIDKEVVSKAEATLFPTAPKLESITNTGVLNPVVDPSFTKIAYAVASTSAHNNGIYILDMGNRSLLTLAGGSTQIVDDTVGAFSTATFIWSPDGQNLLATVANASKTIYLLNTSGFNNSPQDVTETVDTVLATWGKEKQDKETARLGSLRDNLKNFAESNFSIMSWSPDETKILYSASNSAILPQVITPPLIGADSTKENRNLEKGAVYVYDTKEDKNFKISDSQDAQSLTWFPDSKHLIAVQNKRINIEEYDGANNTTIYAGPFIDSYVFPWPTGTQIVVLTNFNNPDSSPNLYTIQLK